MKKDIFIDNCAAVEFCNPPSQEYKDLISWLMKEGVLVVSNKLLQEYNRTMGSCAIYTNICVIISMLTTSGRLVKIPNSDLKKIDFSKKKKLRSNIEDHDHIKLVLLTERKIALTKDVNLTFDLTSNFPEYSVQVSSSPSDLTYK